MSKSKAIVQRGCQGIDGNQARRGEVNAREDDEASGNWRRLGEDRRGWVKTESNEIANEIVAQ